MSENYCFNYQRYITSSKLLLKIQHNFPKLKKIVVFFIINIKHYKKNILLFYIIVNLCFICNILLFNKEKNNYQVLKFSLRKLKIINFLNNFINIYLPILDGNQNIIKKNIIKNIINKNFLLYRFNYFNFPTIYESSFLCYTNENIYNLINNYQIQLDIYLKTFYFIKNSLEFLLRIYRFPIKIQVLNN